MKEKRITSVGMGSSVASFLVLGVASPPNLPTEKKIVTYMRERAKRACASKHIFSGLKIYLHTYNQYSSLLLLMAWRYYTIV